MAKADITAALLRELLHYDPDTGEFRWIKARKGVKVGRRLGVPMCDGGYLRLAVDGEAMLSHRAAWVYMTGDPPPKYIDHIDGNRQNNRWSNLREATKQQNNQNVFRANHSNGSGIRGVSWSAKKKKWRAQIMVNRKNISLGYFADKQEASAAYLSAKMSLHPFAFHGGVARES